MRLQPERHQQHGEQAPRHDPEAGERHAQQVGDDAEQRQAIEVVGSEGARGDRGDQGRGQAGAESGAPSATPSDAGSSARSCRRRRQGAAASQPAIRATTAANDIWKDAPVSDSGAMSEHDDGRPGDEAQRQRRAVEQDRQQREGRHRAGALGRHRRAGERRVEERGHQGEHGRHLLGIDAQRQRRNQRDAVAHEAHHQADHEHDVQAGDRQDVRQARDRASPAPRPCRRRSARRPAATRPRRLPARAIPS